MNKCPRCNQSVHEFAEVCQICGCELEGTKYNGYDNNLYENDSDWNENTIFSESLNNKFKIESFVEGKISNIDGNVIIATLLPITLHLSPKTYVFKSNSIWVAEILRAKKVDNIALLNINDEDFIVQSGFIDGKMTDMYYQRDILENDEFDKTEVYNDITECAYRCRLDMYFYYIFELIVRFEYRERNRPILNLEDLYAFYMTVAKTILLKGCSYRDNDNNYSYNYSFGECYQNYLDECVIYKDVILDYINCDEQLQRRLKIKDTENPFFHPNATRFFQECMFFGYELAKERIKEYLYSKDYFTCRIEMVNGKEMLIVNLTPYGSINKNLLKNMIEERTIINFYNQTLSKLGCVKINHQKVIYKVDNSFFGYIVRRFPWQNDFMLKRINLPHISAALSETQANYEQIKLQ